MRVAILADIHGNLVALEAVLADIARQRVERLVCLGDVAATGPQPRQVVERLRALDIQVVMGNADEWLLSPPPEPAADEDTRRIEEIDLWCAEQLGPDGLAYLRSFQSTVVTPLGADVTLRCFHGSPRSNTEIVMATTPEPELDELLAGADESLLAGGHTHHRLLRRHGSRTVLNPGSVGMSPDRPWAEYAVIDVTDDAHDITFRRVRFDLEAFLHVAAESGMPHADWLVAQWRRAGA